MTNVRIKANDFCSENHGIKWKRLENAWVVEFSESESCGSRPYMYVGNNESLIMAPVLPSARV